MYLKLLRIIFGHLCLIVAAAAAAANDASTVRDFLGREPQDQKSHFNSWTQYWFVACIKLSTKKWLFCYIYR